jgi:hypothetical protein
MPRHEKRHLLGRKSSILGEPVPSEVMKVSFKVQKKGMGSMNKKGKIGGLKFWSSSVKYINLKKLPNEKGRIMEIHEKCGFLHDFA